MPITVIPAPDQSGAIAGWQILADALRQRAATRRAQQASYQDLVLKLSDPNTTEDQQNAVLTQDPKQFAAQYGVPLAQVGKDVAAFRGVAKDAIAPVTPAGSASASGEGMSVNVPAFQGNKRVLVEHPQGTPAEQQATANLAHTRAETAASETARQADAQRTQYYQQQLGLSSQEAARKEDEFNLGFRNSLRTADNKVPTPGQIRDYRAGTFDLYPTSDAQRRIDEIDTILGGDSKDPAHAYARTVLLTDLAVKQKDLERIGAEIDNYRAEADLRKQRMEVLAAGIDPETGEKLDKPATIHEVIAINDAFNKGIEDALGKLGLPTRMTTTGNPWVQPTPTGVGPLTLPISIAWGGKMIEDNPALGPALFGDGDANPAAVRRDLLATARPGQKITTIDIPGTDKKTGLPTMVPTTIDQAVPIVSQMRRKLATSMPLVFEGMRRASLKALLEISIGNPLVYQMAKSYAPDVAAAIDAARKDARTPGAPGAAAAPPVDPNVAPLVEAGATISKQLDEIRALLKGTSAPPTSPPAAK